MIISFYFAYLWRHYLSLDAELFLFVILVCVSTDIGGYIFGNIFKGKKLTKISPKKTISGVIGALIFSILMVPIFYKYLNLNINFLFWVTIFISTISQLGDLFISFLKRKAKVKDTGNLLPGHGGVLDRLDGIFLGIPFGFITYIVLS